MKRHQTFNGALAEALKQAGRNVDPGLLRDRARTAGRHVPGVFAIDQPGCGGNTGRLTYEINVDALPILRAMVDELIEVPTIEPAETPRRKRSTAKATPPQPDQPT
jgi:hypothetical protein